MRRALSGSNTPRLQRQKSASRRPSLDTVWEAVCEGLTGVPVAGANQAGGLSTDDDTMLHMNGPLSIRLPLWGPINHFVRRPWRERFGVLIIEHDQPPCVLLFAGDQAKAQLQEEIQLLPPLQLHCIAGDESASKRSIFSLSSGGLSPMEFGVATEELRAQWMWALAESMSCSARPSPERSLVACTELEGGLRLMKARVADSYRMGKVLASGTDFMVVEGVHLATARSHALKLLNKSSDCFHTNIRRALDKADISDGKLFSWRPSSLMAKALGGESITRKLNCHSDQHAVGGKGGGLWHELRKLCGYLGDVYEGPKHVCLVMEWGTHERDPEHLLSAVVLQALRLLHELLPISPLLANGGGLMLCAEDVRALIRRTLLLDWRLQANLFL